MKQRRNLTEQLFLIYVLVISILIISLGLVLPKTLLPIYEENLYNYLKQPLDFIEDDIDKNKINSEIVYLYVNDSSNVLVSGNFGSVIKTGNIEDILKKIDSDYGKFNYKLNTYYYNTTKTSTGMKIAITNDKYINAMRKDMLFNIAIVVGLTFIIVALLLISWSNNLVNRIKKLKYNVDNIDNDHFKTEINANYDDELNTLAIAIENMRKYLKEQEEYKNQMYQNISHDFKTPITVMKAYVDATEDGVESKEKALEVIKEQLNKLEIKVHSLLYLNKLNYIEDKKENLNLEHDVSITINNSVEKFKVTRPDVKFDIDIDKKSKVFHGSADMWEAIIDNILNNFVRYADKKISITVKNKRIVFYNDGPKIDDNIINNIFTPYEKGVKGVFGLGLSIVKRTLRFLDYDITIENDKKCGVRFIIK